MKSESVIEALRDIKEKRGALTARGVVEESRPKSAPLHPKFEWDDQRAGESWREWQARKLIRSVRVIDEGTQEPRRVFVHVPAAVRNDDEEAGHYEEMTVVVRSIDLFERAISDLMRQIHALQQSAEELRRLATGELPEQKAMISALMASLRTAENIARQIQH